LGAALAAARTAHHPAVRSLPVPCALTLVRQRWSSHLSSPDPSGVLNVIS
jgi:hypothetical protein